MGHNGCQITDMSTPLKGESNHVFKGAKHKVVQLCVSGF